MGKPTRLVTVLLAVLGLLVAGCGSDDGGSPEGSAAADRPGEESTGVTEAKAAVADLTERPTEIPQTTPVEGEVPPGVTIDWLQCGVPSCVLIGNALKEAAAAVGWQVNTINAGLSPEELKAAFAQAVRNEPDAVITTGGYDRAIYRQELRQLNAADIPVVANADFVPAAPEEGIIAVPSGEQWHSAIGEAEANWVIADSDGEASVLIPESAFPIQEIQTNAFRARLDEACPDCELTTMKVATESIGQDLPGKIAQQLQANPDVDYLVSGFGDMMVGVPDALRGGGIEQLPIITPEPNAITYSDMRDGEIAASMNNSTPEGMWGTVDLLIRYFLDEPFEEEPPQAHWILTQETLPEGDEFPTVENYQQQFKELWGVE